MPLPSNRNLVRLATAAALIAALGLAGCGRRGPLEPPPSALAGQPVPGAEGPGQPTSVEVGPSGGGAQAPITGNRPSQRTFILDPLLY